MATASMGAENLVNGRGEQINSLPMPLSLEVIRDHHEVDIAALAEMPRRVRTIQHQLADANAARFHRGAKLGDTFQSTAS